MNKTKKLFYNTLILTGTSFLMRTVGVSFNVYLSNKIGAAGIGLFQLIMTVYSLAITVGAAGVRLSSTRLVVEEAGLGQKGGFAIMRRCIAYGLMLGLFAALLLFFGADMASMHWIDDVRAAPSLRILAFSLPFISMSAAMNGYFTATREIPQYSFVQIAEQTVKLVTIVVSLNILKDPSIETACIALVGATTFSEIVSFLLSYALYLRMKRKSAHHASAPGHIWKKIVRIAVPDGVGSTVRSVLVTVEQLLIPLGFRKSGSSEEASLATYGTIHGMVLPIVLYPSAILSSLAGLLIPELAECNAQQNRERIMTITTRVMHLTLLFSLGTAGILYAFADKLSLAIYNDLLSAQYIRVLAPLVPVMYLDMTVDGILKGMDQQLQSMRYNIYDAALCVALVYYLLPRYAVKGYIFIVFVSEVFNFFLSVNRLIKVTQVKLNILGSMGKPLGCILGALLSVHIFFSATAGRIHPTAELVLLIGATVFFYFIYLYLCGCITQQDIKWMRRVVA
ncbi:MAG: oligosaccharide flippase family protein [Oscillospiraceae bacterium]|jgi:stage V sporulation protein B|nr:oligosaccharide flippase family protein [Oscillospiraceae bacterium]